MILFIKSRFLVKCDEIFIESIDLSFINIRRGGRNCELNVLIDCVKYLTGQNRESYQTIERRELYLWHNF